MRDSVLRAVGSIGLATLAGCAPVRTDVPTAAPDTDFDLTPGAIAAIAGTPLRIRFDAVADDSRCPSDVQCVWEGNATIRLTADSAGQPRTVELKTSGTPSPVRAFGHDIAFRALRPVPTSGSRIPENEYVVTLRVTR
jgi:hypothetical protein